MVGSGPLNSENVVGLLEDLEVLASGGNAGAEQGRELHYLSVSGKQIVDDGLWVGARERRDLVAGSMVGHGQVAVSSRVVAWRPARTRRLLRPGRTRPGSGGSGGWRRRMLWLS